MNRSINLVKKNDLVAANDSIKNEYVPFESEVIKAKLIYKNGIKTVRNSLLELAAAKTFDISPIDDLIDKLIESVKRNRYALIGLCRIKDMSDYTYSHSLSSAILIIAFSIEMGFDDKKTREIAYAAILGDVGKLRIKKDILNKPEKLTKNEFEEIKKHAHFTYALLKKANVFSDTSIRAAVEHHERWDGTGYPRGLVGNAISTPGQMTAIVDVYDALTSPRCYMNAQEPTDMLKKMFSWGETHFNPILLKKFVKLMGTYPVGTLLALSNAKIAVVVSQSGANINSPIVKPVYDLESKKLLRESKHINLDKQDNDLKVIKHLKYDQLFFNPLSVLTQ